MRMRKQLTTIFDQGKTRQQPAGFLKQAILFLSFFALAFTGIAQKAGGIEAVKGELVKSIPSLRNLRTDPTFRPRITRDSTGLIVKKTATFNRKNYGSNAKGDPMVQRQIAANALLNGNTIEQNYEGMSNSWSTPADPTLTTGPNHVVQMINGQLGSQISIWDKAGTVLVGQKYIYELFTVPNYDGAGDPVTMYDQFADRFFITEFGFSNGVTGFVNTLLIAVSQTADPTGAWNVYQFVDNSFFVDYPHYGVWPHALYATSNDFNTAANAYLGSSVYAFDKDAMIAGSASVQMIRQRFDDGEYTFYALAPVNLSGATQPAAGSPGMFMYFTDDNYTADPSDADNLRFITFQPDFVTPANSVISTGSPIPTAPFKSGLCDYARNCIPASGGSYDALSDRIMNRIYYRNFGTHESVVLTHTVDANHPSGPEKAGVRWYELRRTGGGDWAIHQQSTYAPDTDHRWMGTIGINSLGQIALGYNHSGPGKFASIYFVGRNAADPLNAMTTPETVVKQGTGFGTFGNRWGDYNDMSVDPTNDQTFWMTAMYGNNLTAPTRRTTRINSMTIGDACPVITLSPETLSDYQYNQPYTATLSAEGSTALPYQFTISSGALPPGLSLSADGVISGTPNSTTVNTSTFTVRVADANNCAILKQYTLDKDCPVITVSPETLPGYDYNKPYAANLSADGSIYPPYTFSLQSGSLPIGLSLSTGGVISGTPTGTSNSASFVVKITDAVGCFTTKGYTLTSNNVFTFTNACDATLISISQAVAGTATPYENGITVAGYTGNIMKLTVTLNKMNHTYTADLDIMLVGPLGQRVMLLSDAAGSGNLANTTLTFDDEATATISSVTTNLASGTYKPVNYGAGADAFPAPAPGTTTNTLLSVFNGTDPNGTWKLYVVDDLTGDGGNISEGWCLNIIAAAAPEITCPPNIVVANDPGACTASVSLTGANAATATGNPSSAITYIVDGQPIATTHVFPVGTTTVTAKADNGVGTDECTFTVKVNDTELPQITSCPSSQEVCNDPGKSTASVTLNVAASDNCPGVVVKYFIGTTEISSPYDFPVGSPTTVTVKATDAAVNEATCSFTVTVKPLITYYADVDGDGFGDAANTTQSCSATPPPNYLSDNSDCDDNLVLYQDSDGDGFGSATKVACSGVSNTDDCDDTQTFYSDFDNDGFGSDTKVACGGVSNSDDCNDNLHLYSDSDGDGFGSDTRVACGGVTNSDDCDDSKTTYQDFDGDGFGSDTKVACSGVENSDDCDDSRALYGDVDGDGFGSATKVACGGVSNSDDCDDNQVLYSDADGDGFGSDTKVACGGVANSDDCDDNLTLYADSDGDGFGSSQKVACGGVSNNSDCNDSEVRYQDSDGDTYGSTTKVACGGVSSSPDCNDADPAIYPGALDIPDFKDNNCNGAVDDGPPVAFYQDRDGDGFGNKNVKVMSSSPLAGYVQDNQDCDDNRVSYRDADNDGWGSNVKIPCGWISRTGDCDDNNRLVQTPRTFYRDQDGDKYGNPSNTLVVCISVAPAGYVSNNTDCDDNNAALRTGTQYYRDSDGDGFGSSTNTTLACSSSAPAGYVSNNSDCDDTKFTYPDADGDGFGAVGPQTPCGVSNTGDCNDQNPAVISSQTYYRDADGDGFGNPALTQQACSGTPPSGYVSNNSDCNDAQVLYLDSDGDGFGSTVKVACIGVGNNSDCDDTRITYLDNDSDGYGTGAPSACGTSATNTDCNDSDAAVHTLQTFYQDLDMDGFGNPAMSQPTCAATPPSGYVSNALDCDDTKVTYQDGDGDGFGSNTKVPCGSVTNNTDCNDAQVRYGDVDGDGFGSSTKVACGGVANSSDCDDTKVTYQDNDGDTYGSGAAVACGTAAGNTDCNDSDAAVYPGATEVQDGKDNNCNGGTDEGFTQTWYRDKDGDGFGNPNVFVQSSTQPAGYVGNKLDCDDNYVTYEDRDGDGWGSSTKVPCSLIRRTGDCNDGDRRISSPRTWYRDRDGDKYGNPAETLVICQADAPTGYVSNGTDCNDNNPQIRNCPAVTTQAKERLQEQPQEALAFTVAASPNPFGSRTLVHYSVPVEAKVSLRIVDVLGREVGTLFQGPRKAGRYTTEYNTAKFSAGIYYLRLVATANGREYVQTQKLVKAQ